MIKITFKCDNCGCEEYKLILCDNEIFAICDNDNCMNREEINYIRWEG
jgi:hypothetical protein